MKKEKNLIIFAMLLILVTGFFLRFYKIGEKSLAIDEFLDINAVYGYHKTGNWHAWDFNIEAPSVDDVRVARDERSIVYRWQVVQMLKIFPLNETTVRLVSIFWGMISIITIYFVGAYFSGKKQVGVLSAFFLAINISAIQADQTLRMYAMFIPVFLLFSWSFFIFLEEKYVGNNNFLKKVNGQTGLNILWFFPTLFLGLLSLKTHDLTVNIVFVLVVYFLFQIYFSIKNKEGLYKKYIILTIGAVILGGMACLFFWEFVSGKLGSLYFFMSNFSYLSKLSIDYNSYLIVIFFIFFGIYFSKKNELIKNKIIWVALCYFVILLTAIFLWHHKPTGRYLYFIKPFEIILLSIGVYYFADFMRIKFRKNKNIFMGVVVFILIFVPNYTCFFIKDGIYRKNYLEDEMDYKKIYGYVVKNRDKNDVLITRRGRNYYWRDQNIKIYSIATDINRVKLSSEELQKIILDNDGGWIVFSKDDKKNIKKGTLKYMENNLEKIEIEGMGEGEVFRWKK